MTDYRIWAIWAIVLATGIFANDRSVIDNEVSPRTSWAAGSFGSNDMDKLEIVLNTRPKGGATLSDDPSKMQVRGTSKIWLHPTHTHPLHTWKTADFSGERIYAKVIGKFTAKATPPSRSGSRTNTTPEPSDWASNSLDIDIDVGAKPNDNTIDEDLKEMDEGNYVLAVGEKGSVMLRKLPPNLAEKKKNLIPKAWIERSNTNLDLLDNNQSIFAQNGTKSGDFVDRLLAGEIKLEAVASITGDCVLTARLTFTDPSSGYPQEFVDEVRITIGKPRVDIDVDYDRNGKIEDEPDDQNEDATIDFLADRGALVRLSQPSRGGVPTISRWHTPLDWKDSFAIPRNSAWPSGSGASKSCWMERPFNRTTPPGRPGRSWINVGATKAKCCVW